MGVNRRKGHNVTGPGIGRSWRTLKIGNPNAGADFVITPGGQRWWRITSLVAVLTTSAVVATRQVTLRADTGGDVWWSQPAPSGQAATLGLTYSAFTGAPRDGLFINTYTLPLPAAGLLLKPGDSLRSLTALIDAGDQWSAIFARAEEVPSGLSYLGDELMPLPATESE